jgi:hypothetical protein
MEENAHRSQPSQARSGGDVVDIAIYAALPDCGLWRACRLRESVHPPMTPAEASMAGASYPPLRWSRWCMATRCADSSLWTC